MSPLVTLSTDVGEVYSAQMKAVLYRRLPPGSVVELTHSLPPHRVPESAFLLRHMAERFPNGTVHVGVVDPGVGSERAPLGIGTAGGSILVGPDNGLLWPLALALGEPRPFRLDPARVVGTETVSPTFEGRDLFAPAAALLASGASLEYLGVPTRAQQYEIPAARARPAGIDAVVLYIDRFGNLITNAPTSEGPTDGARVSVQVGRGPVRQGVRRRTYAEIPTGGWAVLGSSYGYLEVSCREQAAHRRFRAHVGDRLRLRWRQ